MKSSRECKTQGEMHFREPQGTPVRKYLQRRQRQRGLCSKKKTKEDLCFRMRELRMGQILLKCVPKLRGPLELTFRLGKMEVMGDFDEQFH